MTERIFISHSFEDKKAVMDLERLLQQALAIPHEDLYGPRLKTDDVGKSLADEIRATLMGCEMVLGLVTNNSLESQWVLHELGAAWGMNKNTVCLLAPKLNAANLPAPYGHRLALNLSREEDVTALLERMAGDLGYRLCSGVQLVALVKEFVRSVKRHLP